MRMRTISHNHNIRSVGGTLPLPLPKWEGDHSSSRCYQRTGTVLGEELEQ
jgi:hypothetical protein